MCSRSRPDDVERFAAICERERCPFAVVGEATAERTIRVVDGIRPGRASTDVPGEPIDMPLEVLLGKPPRMRRDVKRRNATPDCLRFRSARSGGGRAPGAPAADGGRQDVPHLDRGSHGDGPRRPRPVRRSLAGSGGRRGHHARGPRHALRRGDGDRGANAAGPARRGGLGPHGGRRSAHEPRLGPRAHPRERPALGQLDGARRPCGRGRRALRRGRGRGPRALPRARDRDPRRQGLHVDAHGLERGRAKRRA